MEAKEKPQEKTQSEIVRDRIRYFKSYTQTLKSTKLAASSTEASVAPKEASKEATKGDESSKASKELPEADYELESILKALRKASVVLSLANIPFDLNELIIKDSYELSVIRGYRDAEQQEQKKKNEILQKRMSHFFGKK